MAFVVQENERQGHTVNKWESRDLSPDPSDPKCECFAAAYITLVSVTSQTVSWLRLWGQTAQIQVLALALNYLSPDARVLFANEHLTTLSLYLITPVPP